MKKLLKQYSQMTIGVFSMSLAYYFFFLPTSLVTGGMTGLSIILEDFLPFPPSAFMLIANSILLLIGLVALGKDFFLKTFYSSLLSPLIIFIFEISFDSNYFMGSVENKLFIAALCGSLLTAFGLGLCFRNNGTTGGMDVIQKIMAKYLHIPYSVTMYFTDWVVIFIGGFSFVGIVVFDIERVVFGFIAVIICGFVVDYIALSGRSRRTAYIVTQSPEKVKEMIYNTISRGVTECDVRGGYTGNHRVMLICTLDKNESYRLSDFVKEIDPDAFTFITHTKEVLGNYQKKNKII